MCWHKSSISNELTLTIRSKYVCVSMGILRLFREFHYTRTYIISRYIRIRNVRERVSMEINHITRDNQTENEVEAEAIRLQSHTHSHRILKIVEWSNRSKRRAENTTRVRLLLYSRPLYSPIAFCAWLNQTWFVHETRDACDRREQVKRRCNTPKFIWRLYILLS